MTDSNSNHSAGEEISRRILRQVDGEASASETRALLFACDKQPRLWKSLALAFLEDQMLRLELREIRLNVRPFAEPPTTPSSPPSQRSTWFRNPSVNVIAALLLMGMIGFGLGRQAGLRGSYSSPLPEEFSSSKAAVASAPLPRGDQAIVPDEVPLFIGDSSSADLREHHLPLVSGRSVEDFPTPPEAVPESWRADLNRAGRNVIVQRRMYPVLLQDGRTVVLPIDEVEVRYLGESAFQ